MNIDKPSLSITTIYSLPIYSVILSLFFVFSIKAHAGIDEPQQQTWKAFNINTVKNYVIPAYKNLNTHTQSLNQHIKKLCQSPINTKEKRHQSQLAFHEAMDAWQYIQNIQFGPIQTLMRNYTLQFWPDKKNHVSKHLFQLLNKDQEALTDDAFHKASVSIKGLPAIERFLFDDELNKTLSAKAFNCKVLMRIANYTEQTTQSLVEEWLELATQLENIQQSDGYFEDDIEAATTLLKTLIEPIEVIRDLKLLRPLGSEFGQQKTKRLESWRSQRSLRNIKMNIRSLADFYQGALVDTTVGNLNDNLVVNNTVKRSHLASILDKKEAENIRSQFNVVLEKLDNIATPIEQSINTQAGYKALVNLSEALKVLHELLELAVNNQGIHLGFNSRDGD